MIVEKGIIAKLLATSGVTSLCSDRIYPGSVPQADPLPAVVVNKISGAPLYTDDGQAGLQSDRVQVDAWAASFLASKTISDAFKAALSGFSGSAGGVTIEFAMIENERDDREGGSNASEYRFRSSVDFIVWYRT
jgi:hypothetical protein